VPLTLEQLLAGSPVAREELERALVGLAAAGAVRSGDEVQPTEPELAGIVARIGERIASSLEARPLELSAEQYRSRIQDCLGSYGGLDFYELFGVPANAATERIQAAYEDLARLVHPSNAARYGVAGVEGPLRAVFERATRAYATLMDGERRREYNERQLVELPVAKPTGARREAELREVARAQFERALAYAAGHDYHNAVQLLEQAVKSDPRPEYWATLASCQARNPSWRLRAMQSYRQAIQLAPDDANVRFALGRLYEENGEPDRARAQYTAALRANRDHLEAAHRLDHLEAERRMARRAGAGWFRRLLGRF
jgi:tetratricopeptide (TPR) repeat protein